MNTQNEEIKRPSGCFKIFVMTILILFVGCWIWWINFLESYYNSKKPQNSDVGEVIYYTEKVYGLGPGGNEVVIIVYGLDDETKKSLSIDPKSFVENLPHNGKPNHKCSIYKNWNETPVSHDTSGRTLNEGAYTDHLKLRDYLGGWAQNPQLKINTKFEKTIEQALTSKGNYYSIGRCGLFMFVPSENVAVYLHSG